MFSRAEIRALYLVELRRHHRRIPIRRRLEIPLVLDDALSTAGRRAINRARVDRAQHVIGAVPGYSAYINWGCRCWQCRAFSEVREIARRRRQRTQREERRAA